MTRFRFGLLTVVLLVGGWLVSPAAGQDLNTLLVGFLSDLRSGTFSIGSLKDIVISSDGDGAVTFAASGTNGSAESITVNLDDTSDTATFSSATSVTTWTFGDVSVMASRLRSSGTTITLDTSAGAGVGCTVNNNAPAKFSCGNNAVDLGASGAAFKSLVASGTAVLGSAGITTVDGATTFAVTSSVMTLACTGAETINTITGGIAGMVVWIINNDTDCTIADDDVATASNAIDLTGTGTNDVGAVAKVIGLLYDGSSWLQIFESDN